MPVKTLLPQKERPQIDFDSIRLKVASPDAIRIWSYGEVVKPETINYRTQKPEKDGLFDERIFGPTRDFECYCGKYKRIRYKGIVCEKCGVEVTRSIVRRERMGHIELAAPVSHIWFLRGVPSKLGLLLNLSVADIEKVVYFANYIVTEVNEELRQQALDQVRVEYKQRKKQIDNEYEQKTQQIKDKQQIDVSTRTEQLKTLKETEQYESDELTAARDMAIKELSDLKPYQVISESTFTDLSLKYGQVFSAGIGAESIRYLLEQIDLNAFAQSLASLAEDASKSQIKRINKRLKLVRNLIKNDIRPEWMVITVLPVIPPDLRPMVALDGGRFAASDLNDLYRRVINRNNRLKRLIELNAPEVIIRNEKRMLQEAVDALIDNNARHGKTVTASTGQKRTLKSLADALKGKQGRFRQNLLGKRTDYSGRSVIVVGPHLNLHQCGIPKYMALELFKPFVIAQLIKREVVHNVRSANRYIEAGESVVWDILEEITKESYVLLNRAPTLHRLGIQAFKPVLIEGKAITVHPLVCPAFNADFDGDQMAVHVPLTVEARNEAQERMLSVHNLLKPGDGTPIVKPQQDMIWGIYYMTYSRNVDESILDTATLKIFSSPEEVIMAYENNILLLQEFIRVPIQQTIVTTTPGRIIFNSILPDSVDFVNQTMDSSAQAELVAGILDQHGQEESAKILDDLKRTGFKYLTVSGLSWGMKDLPQVKNKYDIIQQAEHKVQEINDQYNEGLLTNDERHARVIELWAEAKDQVVEAAKILFDRDSSVHTIIDSKARGSWAQMSQMMGMKGNVTNPAGELIELPVKASFKEGMEVLEYFISTHGARKGLSDTALRTANAGYLTRRLIDVSQDIVVIDEDCGDVKGFVITQEESKEMNLTLAKRCRGRFMAQDIMLPKKKKPLVAAGELVTDELAQKIAEVDVERVTIRSVLTCRSVRGICKKCYGWDLGYNKLVKQGTAVGIIAAQSIGEPGTQLTMRTFHTGGVAGADITQGLPRVEEVFEARPVKKAALVAPFDAQLFIEDVPGSRQKIAKLKGHDQERETVAITQKNLDALQVKEGDSVRKNQVLLEVKEHIIKAPISGLLSIVEQDKKTVLLVITEEREVEKELLVPSGFGMRNKTGDLVARGDQLTDGSSDLHELFHLKGIEAVQKYILKEILYIYTSQGQRLNEKHVEIIVRQMFSRVLINDPGDSDYLAGEVAEYSHVQEENNTTHSKGGKIVTFSRLLLGITKVSLSTESWLSAASFQETAKVLIDAAVTGKVDHLRGLKENVIIGRLIPAGTGFTE